MSRSTRSRRRRHEHAQAMAIGIGCDEGRAEIHPHGLLQDGQPALLPVGEHQLDRGDILDRARPQSQSLCQNSPAHRASVAAKKLNEIKRALRARHRFVL
jgi:hypothetical protein